MKKIIIILILLLLPISAIADTKKEIAECAAKDKDGERLVCYDNLAKSLGVDKPFTKVTKGKGKWIVSKEISPIDDSVNVVLTLNANELVTSGYNQVEPTLVLRCAENTTNAYLVWGLYLGLDKTKMLTRLDKQEALISWWSISTDNKAVFVRGSDIQFIKKLMNHEKLLAQITPYGESPVIATFDIGGLSEAIKPLRKACNW